MKTIARLAPVLITFFLPAVASAAFSVGGGVSGNGWSFGFSYGNGAGFACAANNICQIASTILYLINYVLIPLLFAIAFIVFLYGVAKAYIFSSGEADAVSEGHRLILWGVVGFAVMVSLWGLVNIVVNTFGLAGAYAPAPPVSPY